MGLKEQITGFLNWGEKKAQGLLAVHLRSDGVGFAYTSVPQQHGEVDLCDFVTCSEDERFKVVKQFIKQHGLGQQLDVNLVLPPSDYKTLTIDAPDVEPSEYHQAAKWLVKDLLDYPVTEAAIDLFPMPVGSQKKLYLVCARQSLIRQYINEFQKLNLSLVGVETPELALRNLLLLKKEPSCLLLYKTDFFTGVMIYKDQAIYLVRAIRGDLEELSHKKVITELQRSLDYYQKQTKLELPQKLMMTPNLSGYENLEANLEAQLGMPIEYLHPDKLVTLPSNLDPETQMRLVASVGATQSIAALQVLPSD